MKNILVLISIGVLCSTASATELLDFKFLDSRIELELELNPMIVEDGVHPLVGKPGGFVSTISIKAETTSSPIELLNIVRKAEIIAKSKLMETIYGQEMEMEKSLLENEKMGTEGNAFNREYIQVTKSKSEGIIFGARIAATWITKTKEGKKYHYMFIITEQ